jgi:hypothetical protein
MQGHEMSGPYSDFEGLVASLLHKLKSSVSWRRGGMGYSSGQLGLEIDYEQEE